MDPEKFKNQTKKATSTLDVDIFLTEYIDPEYEIKTLSNNPVISTGRLDVVKGHEPQKLDKALNQFLKV